MRNWMCTTLEMLAKLAKTAEVVFVQPQFQKNWDAV